MRAAFPLPPAPHVPGRNARPDEAYFAAVKAATPVRTTSVEAAANPAWAHGLDCLVRGYFWECHEVLEPVWWNAPQGSPERAMVRAVIQLANAALKQAMGRPGAVARLCGLVDACARAAHVPGAPRVMGLDGAEVRAAARALEARAASGAPVEGIALSPQYAI